MASPVKLKVLMDLSDGVVFNETSALCFDISDIVMHASTRRGRNRELDKIEAGYAVITIVDENGDFNPENVDSPYYGNLLPGRKIRLYPLYDDGTGEFRYPDIFTGYISNFNIAFAVGVDTANQVTIEAYDALRIFNSVSITDVVNATNDDTSDERIDAILDEITWPSGLRSFEPSVIQLDADQGDLRTVLDAIRQVEDTEAGLFYIDGSGVAQFKNRATVNEAPDALNAYYFSDNGTATSYNDLSLIQDDSMLYNRVTVKSYNGTNEATVMDTSSVDTYFIRSAERQNVLLSSTTELQDLALTLLDNNKDSALAIESITLNLGEYQVVDRVIAGLYFDIFFIPVNIEKALAGDTSISRLGWVQGVNHDISPKRWLVTAFTGLTDQNPAPTAWLASRDSYYLTQVKRASNNNIYAVEYRNGGARIYYLNPDGSAIWKKDLTGNLYSVYQIILDDNDDLYLAADYPSAGSGIVAKIDKSGNLIWDIRTNKRSEFDSDVKAPFSGIAINSNNVYAISYPVSGENYSYLLALDLDGNVVWQKRIVVGADRKICYYNNALYAGGTDYVTKYDTSGNVVWNYAFDNLPANTSLFKVRNLTVNDSTGDIWITSTNNFSSPSGATKLNIMKLEDNGTSATLVFQTSVDAQTTALNNAGYAHVTDIDQNTYIIATLNQDDNGLLVLKFDVGDNLVWQRQIVGGFNNNGSIDIGPSDYIYLGYYATLAHLPGNGDKTGTYTVSTGYESFVYRTRNYSLIEPSITLSAVTGTTQTSEMTFTTNNLSVSTSSNSLQVLEI